MHVPPAAIVPPEKVTEPAPATGEGWTVPFPPLAYPDPAALTPEQLHDVAEHAGIPTKLGSAPLVDVVVPPLDGAKLYDAVKSVRQERECVAALYWIDVATRSVIQKYPEPFAAFVATVETAFDDLAAALEKEEVVAG